MIPILYSNDERAFESNGLGRLADCLSCVVTEERNGIYELELTYPITGRFYAEMHDNGGIIGVIHDDRHDVQLFDIYKFSAPIDGVVTFNAHHISYRLSNVIVEPFEAENCTEALQGLKTHSVSTNPFTFWTDKATTGDFSVKHPEALRALLGGQEGSILDIYGKGDYEFDRFEVKLYANRGHDTGVTIRYGKNMTDITHERDQSGAFSAIAPFWMGEDEIISLPEVYIVSPTLWTQMFDWTDEYGNPITGTDGETLEFNAPVITPAPLDMTSYFDGAPTADQLRAAAQAYMERNEPWKPSENITVDFVQLWQTPEYANVAALQRVSLCDTVSVYYPELGVIQAEEKVVKTVYNVLLERYDSIELGELRTTFAETVGEGFEELVQQSEDTLRSYVEYATKSITGGLGGYVVMTLNAARQPQEILIMDTPDIETAVNVWRWNQGGLGHSHSGYAGPYGDVAITQDGRINASMISTGFLLASYIRGGTLTLGGLSNSYGLIRVLSDSGEEIGTWNRYGLSIKEGEIAIPSEYGETRINYGGLNSSGYDSNGSRSVSVHNGGISCIGHDTEVTNIWGGGITVDGAQGDLDGIEVQCTTTNEAVSIAYTGVFFINNQGTSVAAVGLNGASFHGLPGYFGSLTVTGSKNRLANAGQYGDRLLYCYETPSPLFGDVGEGEIAEDGACYVWLDPIFAQTIATDQYQVFLQKYGEGDCYVSERHPGYFIVKGTPGLSFGWELKAKQSDFDQKRLDKFEQPREEESTDYGAEAAQYITELNKGRLSA